MEPTGILIAGGRSLRMGSDKAALLFHGTTFAQRAIGLLKTFCTTVMVSYNGEPFANDVTFIKDIHPGLGPISGLHAALTASPSDYNLVMAIDLPFIEPLTLQTLVSESCNFDATAFRRGEFVEPLCAVYRKNVLQTIEKQIADGDYSLQKLLQTSNTNFLDLTQERSLQFRNINTPDEYKAIANK